MRVEVTRGETPLGPIVVRTGSAGVLALEFLSPRTVPETTETCGKTETRTVPGRTESPGRAVLERVRRWFDGDLAAFDDVVVAADGTPFERRVWTALRRIPPGETTTYGALAASIGRPGAARAVGRANACNPVALIVPCHRVIGADGSLTGYAGGLERKRRLLEHEREFSAAGRT